MANRSIAITIVIKHCQLYEALASTGSMNALGLRESIATTLNTNSSLKTL